MEGEGLSFGRGDAQTSDTHPRAQKTQATRTCRLAAFNLNNT